MDGVKISAGLQRKDALLLGLCSLVLFGSSWFCGRVLTLHEARLPQASIEMAKSGEWLIPTCGGRAWLERPPVPHWITIGVASAFGVWDQEWVFRIPPALAGVLCVMLTGWIAGKLFDRDIGVLSGLMLATSFEFTRYAWMAEEDIFLAAVVLIGMAWFVRMEFETPASMRNESQSFLGNRSGMVWGFFLFLGLSNMVKGLLFGALMVGLSGGTFLLFSGNPKRLLRYVWFWGWGLFAVAAVWWVIAVSVRYPDMLQIWLGDVRGRTDGVWSRTPFWYYGETLLWGLIPWPIAAVAGLFVTGQRAWKERDSSERWLWCWAFVPVLFLSIPAHKHHHYLVPCLAPWGILAALGGRAIWRSVPIWPGWCRRPAWGLALSGVIALVAAWKLQEKFPGVWIIAACIPPAVFVLGQGLLNRSGRGATATWMTVVMVAFCAGQSYSGQAVDRYRDDTKFLRLVAERVPKDEPIYVNAEGAILNTFRNLFYLGERGETLHNLTFLLDEKITASRVFVVAKRKAAAELSGYGVVEPLFGSAMIPKGSGRGEQWMLYEVRLDPQRQTYPNHVRISALQAMERVKGPYLGVPQSTAMGE